MESKTFEKNSLSSLDFRTTVIKVSSVKSKILFWWDTLVDSIGIVEAAKEIDGLGLHMCFLWVKHQIVFVGNLHEVL